MYKIIIAKLQAIYIGNVAITLHRHSHHHLMCQVKFQLLEFTLVSYTWGLLEKMGVKGK
jgi:hypothetical protein